ncbi:hypothetical protein Tco_0302108, partial [Tanacetum coccineum]
MPPVIRPPVIINNIPFEQFLASLFSSSSSEFSLTPPPTVTDKGSAPKILNFHQFSTAGEGPLTIKEARAQMEEIKRLADLKAEKEKSEKRLKVLTAEELKAETAELAAYEAKRENMLKEYNHCISFKDGPLPITKISYRVNNSTNKATMR